MTGIRGGKKMALEVYEALAADCSELPAEEKAEEGVMYILLLFSVLTAVLACCVRLRLAKATSRRAVSRGYINVVCAFRDY